MRHPFFKLGVEHRRSGARFETLIADIDSAWNYERGRLWASLAPRSMALFINGQLNPKARALYDRAADRGLIP
jgi:hypothetical protein